MHRKKTDLAATLAGSGKFPIRAIAGALQVSRSNIIARKNKRADSYQKADDENLMPRIGRIIRERPGYGYRRVTGFINRELKQEGSLIVNHKRI